MAKRSQRKKTPSSGISPGSKVSPAVGQAPLLGFKREWLCGLILILAVIVVYQPVWYAGFIWDDDKHLTANPCMIGPEGLKEIWTSSAWRPFPLVITVFWVEHALWGLAPLPYHLVNVVEQAACAVLLWRVLKHLQIPGAWLGAALWALHPLQVESVAWISEMKNTQSGLFYLLTILFFVRGLKQEDLGRPSHFGWNDGLSLVFAVLAMLSKSSTLVLPVVLGLCAWWMEGRLQRRQLIRLVPIFLLSVLACIATTMRQASALSQSIDPQWTRSGPERIASSGDAIWFYLGKLVWPHPLMAVYPRWMIDAGSWVSYLPLLAVIIVLLVLGYYRGSWSRPYFFAFSYYLVALSPFLGLMDQSFWLLSFVEDHLQYLASMGPVALIAAGMVRLADRIISPQPWLRSSLAAVLLMLLGFWSWQLTWVYEGEETLWTDELVKNPNCWVGQNNLGDALMQKRKVNEAVAHYQKAVELNPQFAQANNNLGYALTQEGRFSDAIAPLQKAVELNPNYAKAHNNLGIALVQIGQLDKALAEFQKALIIIPDYSDAQKNLGIVQALARQRAGSE
jgi:tetratricopeptide (TPR) repeat protein